MTHSMVIIGVTQDKYELPVKVYTSYKEMSDDLNISIKRCYDLVDKHQEHKPVKLKFYKYKCEVN